MTRFTWKGLTLAVGCLVALAPGMCSAALSLRFGPPDSPIPVPPQYPVDAQGRHYFDLFFTETAPTENEGLFAYDLSLLLRRPPGTTGGARLTGAERPADNFVLDVPSGATFTVAESGADDLLINISSNNDLADINTGDKAARIFYEVDPGVNGRNYTITFDPSATVFGSGDPNRELVIAVNLGDGVQLPDPAGLSLLAWAGVLGLRRRRRVTAGVTA